MTCECYICKCDTEIEKEARDKWNKQADEYNQWHELGRDEKDELVMKLAKEKGINICRRCRSEKVEIWNEWELCNGCRYRFSLYANKSPDDEVENVFS